MICIGAVRRLAVVGVLLAGSILGACGGEEQPLGPTATVPQGTTTTNPYAVPAVIDEPYVNRVLAGLDHAMGEVTRMVVREESISQEAISRLKALYAGDYLNLTLASFEADLRNGLSTYREKPGDRTTVVTQLISTSPSCVFAEVSRDYSAASNLPSVVEVVQWIAIQPTVSQFPDYNPTRWMLLYDGYDKGRVAPSNPCDATS
jgi:hypothetical protein